METIATFVNILACSAFAVAMVFTVGGMYFVATQSSLDAALYGRAQMRLKWPMVAVISGAWLLAQHLNT